MFGKNNRQKIIFLFIALIGVFAWTMIPAFAQVNFQKDSDNDGISDDAEIEKYKTDPNNPDSDNDGIIDSQEIIEQTNPNDSNSSILNTKETDAKSLISKDDPIMWYLSRISGIAAFIMFTIVIWMGLLMTSRILLKFKFLRAPDALQMHSFTASVIAFLLVIIHFGSLFFDDFIKLKPLEVFVPFLFQRDIKTALGYDFQIPVALGVIAFYLSIILIATSQLRRKIFSIKIWRMTHYSSFLFYVLFLVHAILAGTDSKEWWMQSIYIISATSVTGLILLRIFGKKYFLPKIRPAVAPSVTPQVVVENAVISTQTN